MHLWSGLFLGKSAEVEDPSLQYPDASPDGTSTSFIPPEQIPVPAGLDALLFSFRVVDGLVEPSAGAQFRITEDLVMNVEEYRSVGPFPIQLGLKATADALQGPPPQEIHFKVQRGADTGTGILSELTADTIDRRYRLMIDELL